MSAEQKWKPNHQQREIIEALIAEQEKEKSQAEFVRKYLPFGPGVWSKILAVVDDARPKSYFDEVKNPEAVFIELEAALNDLGTTRAAILRMTETPVETTKVRAVAQAVRECRAKKSPERLIKFLAPTGGGKTLLCHFLRMEFSAKPVEARDAWRRSYFCMLEDVCKTIGVRLNGECRPSAVEDKLIAFCSDKTIVLPIDEGEFFGAAALNGLKLLLNKTRLVPVICSIGEAHDRWNRYFKMEAEQLARRTHAIVEQGAIDPKDADLFFPRDAFENREEAIKTISEAGSLFGHFSFVNRLRIRLEGERNATDKDLAKAINVVKKQMQREGLVLEKGAAK